MMAAAASEKGLICRQCGCRHFFTTHTEPMRDGRIRRRRECRHCGRKVVTFELPAADLGQLKRGA